MAQSTGPILAAVGIAVGDKVLVQNQPLPWKMLIAGGFAVGLFALAEPVAPDAVKMLSYLVVVGVLLGGPNGTSPLVDLMNWVDGQGPKTGVGPLKTGLVPVMASK